MNRSTLVLPASLLLFALVAAPGAAQNSAGTPPMSNSSSRNRPVPQRILLPGISTQSAVVKTAQDRYAPGQPVAIAFSVTNPTKKTVDYEFPTSQQFDVTVTDAKGMQVWRWSQGRMFAQVLSRLSLKPGESKTFEAEWSGRDAKGQPVPPGLYTLTATLNTNSRPVVTGGFIVNNDTDPNNMGMPTKSPADTGAIRQVTVNPLIGASKVIAIGVAPPKAPKK